MKKRILALLLAIVMVLSLVPTAFAEDDVAVETQTVEAAPAEATEPAAPAEEHAEPATTEETASEPQNLAADDTAAAQEEPVAEAEEPLFEETGVITDCVCGGKHNGEYGHVCEAVEWTDLTSANADTYFNGGNATTGVSGEVYLRLTEDLTVTGQLAVRSTAKVSIDLNGHTLDVYKSGQGLRAFNVYGGTTGGSTLNICDSSAEGTGKIMTHNKPGSASFIAYFTNATSELHSEVNFYGGTFTNPSQPQVPAVLLYPKYCDFTMWSGAKITGCTNAVTGTTGSTLGGVFNMTGNAENTLTFNGGTIENCTVTGEGKNGGAIYMTKGTLTINPGTVISGCSAAGAGGAIYFGGGTLDINGASFDGNSTSTGNGGAIYVGTGDVSVENASFNANTSGKNGGAVCFTAVTSAATFTNTTFTNNSAAAAGGAIQLSGEDKTYTFNGCTFTGNTSATFGGALACFSSSTTNLIDTVITDNHSACTTSRYQASGVCLRGSATLNISGNTKVYGNTGTMTSSIRHLDIDASAQDSNAGDAARTVNIGELTGDAYVVVNEPTPAYAEGSDASLSIQNNGGATEHRDTDNTKHAFFGAAYTEPSGIGDDVDLYFELTSGTNYAINELMSFDVYAKIADDCTIPSAYIQGIQTTVTADEKVEINSTELNKGFNSDDGKIALYMWDDQTVEAPMQLTKTPTKIGTVYGRALAEGTSEITIEIELSKSVSETPVTKRASTSVTIGAEAVVHQHCACGNADGTFTGHMHAAQAPEWTAIDQTNFETIFNRALVGTDGAELYYYLVSDLTITERLNVGDENNNVTIHLCLNAHTINVAGDCAFALINGKLTICDCAGGGTVTAVANTSTRGNQSARIFFVPDTAVLDKTEVEIFGGTYQLANDAPATSRAQIAHFKRGAVLTIHDGTFDGNNKAATYQNSAGLFHMDGTYANPLTLNVYGGTFQNGASKGESSSGGAFYIINTNVVMRNASFQNNNAASNVSAGAICLNLKSANSNTTAELADLSFSNNTAGEANAENNLVVYDTVATLDDSDFGAIKVGGAPVLTLPGTAKIDRGYGFGNDASITFLDVKDGDILSAETLTTKFTANDAKKIHLGGESTATAVSADDGALVAVIMEDTTIAWITTEFTKTWNGGVFTFPDDALSITGSTGARSYTYYADAESEEALAKAPTDAGTYYVTATVAADLRHPAATTATRAKLTITELPEHEKHCICGDETCTLGGHTHEAVTWTPIGQSNISTIASTGTKSGYYYLIEDVTISTNIRVGNKGEAATFALDLNGHTLTSTANRVFSIYDATVSVCDCKGTGKVVLNPTGATGAFVFFQNSSNATAGASSFNMYGGTVEYMEGATPASHAMIYINGAQTVNIYGGTLDAKGLAHTNEDPAGIIRCEASCHLNLFGGTFMNAAGPNGAIYAGGTGGTGYVAVGSGAKFANNTSGDFTFKSEKPRDITLLDSDAEFTLTGTVAAGSKVALGGGTLNIAADADIVDLAVTTTAEDGGKIVFADGFDANNEQAVITAIAESLKEQKCLPIETAAHTYELFFLDEAAAIYCPAVTQEGEQYKFRMMPRFASQEAYDALKTASEDALAIGFAISVDGGEEQMYDFNDVDEKTYFGGAKDTYAFYVYVSGITEAQTVTVKPYIKLNGMIAYQGAEAPEMTAYTVG